MLKQLLLRSKGLCVFMPINLAVRTVHVLRSPSPFHHQVCVVKR